MGQMKARHDNMLHLANFLYTKTEPRLYYKPWEMSTEDGHRIDDQIAEARATIQREADEYKHLEEEERRRERGATPDESTYRGQVTPSDATSQRTALTQTLPPNNEAANGTATHAQDQEMQDQHAEETRHQPAQPLQTEPAMATTELEPEASADEPLKDADEEVVEAAEDTVIY